MNKTAKEKNKEVNYLRSLANKILEGENSYTKEDIITKIKEVANVSQERAENGFKMMCEKRVIDAAPGDWYYLAGSTPF